MPKENTHIWFANRVALQLRDDALRHAIMQNRQAYHLGAVAPDIFFYAPDEGLVAISSRLHGKGGEPTNVVVLAVLEQARGLRDVVFALGYLTHCALDMTVHPVVYALTGDYYDPDPASQRRAMYRHRHFETCLDRVLGNRARIDRLLRPDMLAGLVFVDVIAARFSVQAAGLRRCFRRQLVYNRLFASRPAFWLLALAQRLGLVAAGPELALFYGNIDRAGNAVPSRIVYPDPQSGLRQETSPHELVDAALPRACEMISAAWGYSRSDLSRDELLTAVPGASLDTGRVETPSGDAPCHTL